ncbi:hypothetical protein JOD18_004893 [Gracilibacillus alcaliphilus]|nr:hypothetical protein [Gracilibacillus alcaliphilus]
MLRQCKKLPQATIIDNGKIDSAILDYKYYEELYLRIQELEEKEESRILLRTYRR